MKELWNAIPDESRKIQTYTTSKNNLKTLDLTGLLVRSGSILNQFLLLLMILFSYTFYLCLHC